MGRLLYCGFLHDHWWVDHIGCHHRHFGTRRDPSTARLDESLARYLVRFFPSQAVSAWRIERKRHQHKPLGAQLLHNTLLHGLLIELGLLWGVKLLFGSMGVALFIFQSLVLMFGLHTVKFFQHWGLVREGKESLAT